MVSPPANETKAAPVRTRPRRSRLRLAGCLTAVLLCLAGWWWLARSPVEWLGPDPAQGSGWAEIGSGWIVTVSGDDGAILARSTTDASWRTVVPGAKAGPRVLGHDRRYVYTERQFTAANGLKGYVVERVPLAGGPTAALYRSAGFMADSSLTPEGLAWVSHPTPAPLRRSGPGRRQELWRMSAGGTAPRKLLAGYTRRDGAWAGPVYHAGMLYWLAMRIGAEERSALWSVPTSGGTPRRLAAGAGRWYRLMDDPGGLAWVRLKRLATVTAIGKLPAKSLAPSAAGPSTGPESFLSLAFLPSRRGTPVWWQDAQVDGAELWDGRWYWCGMGGPGASDGAMPLWSARLDGSTRHPVASVDGRRQALVDGWTPHLPGHAPAYVSRDRDGGHSLCRLARAGAGDRLERLCRLPSGWRWRPLGADSECVLLQADPDEESRFVAWLRDAAHRRRVPMLCRVRLPAR